MEKKTRKKHKEWLSGPGALDRSSTSTRWSLVILPFLLFIALLTTATTAAGPPSKGFFAPKKHTRRQTKTVARLGTRKANTSFVEELRPSLPTRRRGILATNTQESRLTQTLVKRTTDTTDRARDYSRVPSRSDTPPVQT